MTFFFQESTTNDSLYDFSEDIPETSGLARMKKEKVNLFCCVISNHLKYCFLGDYGQTFKNISCINKEEKQ